MAAFGAGIVFHAGLTIVEVRDLVVDVRDHSHTSSQYAVGAESSDGGRGYV